MRADVILRGGSVLTLDAQWPRARSVAVGEGRIVAVGEGDLDEVCGLETRVIELAGNAVLPGFVDAHIHFGAFALGLTQVDLDHAATLENGLREVRAFADRLAAGVWLRGRGWDRNRWGRLPTASELDQVTGARPALLSSHDGHSLWLNSAAMAAVGLSASSEAPAGGAIERDSSGNPSGVVFENAQDLVRRKVPEPTEQDLGEAIRHALPLAAKAGLTGMHNLEDEHSLAAFRALAAEGELTLRVYHGVRRGLLTRAAELGLRTGAGSEWLRIGPVKLFSDGALGSRTAHVLEPYEGTNDRGVPTLTPEELAADMRAAADQGLDIAVHAIGDAAVRTVLDVVQTVRPGRLVRIEHAQLVHPDDVPRFAQLGVLASMQPIHAVADWRAADAHWGARARHGYAWRTLLDAGAVLALGTDAPVERLEPLLNLHAATTRVDPHGEPAGGWYPEQRLTLDEAVRAYTHGSAVAERASERRGRLAPDMDADLVVLDGPLSADRLLETQVVLTMVGGHIVYEA
ncbi:MAG TPA: amidohydrolase [Chloroflexota bacterium]